MYSGTAMNLLGLQPSKPRHGSNPSKRNLPKVLIAIMLLLSLSTLVNAQDGANTPLPTGISNTAPDAGKKDEPAPAAPPAADSKPPQEMPTTPPAAPETPPAAAETPAAAAEETPGGEEFLKTSNYSIHLESIYPAQGPATGDTKVTVRGGPFAKYEAEHPEPKCKFGDAVVGGMYVPCPPKAAKIYEKEGGQNLRTTMCI